MIIIIRIRNGRKYLVQKADGVVLDVYFLFVGGGGGVGFFKGWIEVPCFLCVAASAHRFGVHLIYEQNMG